MKLHRYFLRVLLLLAGFFPFFINAQNTSALFRAGVDPVAGNPQGKVTLVEFFDYQCGYCVTLAPILTSLAQRNPNLRIVYKDIALLGSSSTLAAYAALAAQRQGKYQRMHRALLNINYRLSTNNILAAAKNVGLNMSAFENDFSSDSVRIQLKNNINLARALGVGGTPACFIGYTKANSLREVDLVLGSATQQDLQSVIDQYR